MKYYSEELKRFYDTEEECMRATNQFLDEKKREAEEANKKAKARAERAKEVEEAQKAMRQAEKNYHDVLEKFLKDYGSYHMTATSADDIPLPFRWLSLL